MLDRLPSVLLRVEGLAVLVAAVTLYFHADYRWWLLPALFLAPDLGLLGYLAGVRAGAVAYDTLHLEALPVALGVVGLLTESDASMTLALVWLAHIGMDRALGYGLKYPTVFKDSHLQRV